MKEREKFSSRLGFILITAGCAIGLGNVWRFPFIAGKYGGGAFVLLYLLFLIILGVPIMTMELTVGRASGKSSVESFRTLEQKGEKWHIFGYIFIAGNYLLMMFYTTVTGWMLYYFFRMLRGGLQGASQEMITGIFTGLLANPVQGFIWMALATFLGFFIVRMGLQDGVEKITTRMLAGLFIIMIVLIVRILMLPGAKEGIRFYLYPDFGKLIEEGWKEATFAAMGQAFFTLSIGMSAIAIFGSYVDRSQRLMGEAVSITVLDTLVAFMSGLIIIPAAFSFSIPVDSGPPLIFITLPRVFASMGFGNLWGGLFFLFMSFAALSTVIAVFENIVSFWMDTFGYSREKAVDRNFVALLILAIPCVLGFNLWSGFQPLGPGSNILDLEDFLISNNILPLGSLVYIFFTTAKKGWGWEGFLQEANTGRGMKFPASIHRYLRYVMPVIIVFISFRLYLYWWQDKRKTLESNPSVFLYLFNFFLPAKTMNR